jgi:uracil-DNA glycosylase
MEPAFRVSGSPALESIFQEIAADPANCRWTSAGYLPLYTASERARIVVVGQAPGRKAQESGIPWNDVSGIKLRNWLGVSDEQFYNPELIAQIPMDFYYPGKGTSGDLPPRPDFAPAWHPRILAAMPNVQLTVLIGRYAHKYYLGAAAKPTLTQTVQAYLEYLPGYFPIVHPSPLNFRWQARNPWFERQVVPTLRELVAGILAD